MKKWLPLAVISLGTFMLLIDVTIVNVALPQMARSLSTSFTDLQWVVDAYALTLAALLLGVGGVADRVGHRTGYLAGLAVFGVSSLVCGFAPTTGVLIAARAVQGIGGAAMFAATFALLNRSYTGRDRGTAYGIWGAVSGAAAAIGPVLGGVLTQTLSWNWIFYVNVPISAVAILLALRVLPQDRPEVARRIDMPGIAAFTVGVGALTLGLIRTGTHAWSAPSVWLPLVVAVLAFTAFVVIEATVAEPMVDLQLLRRPSFVGTLLAALVLNFAAFAALTYSSIWTQSVLGLSPISAGLVTLAMAASAFVVAGATGRLVHGRAPGPIVGGGLIVIGLGAVLDAVMISSDSGWPALLAGFAVIGIGVGVATPTLSSAAMSAVPMQRGGMAAGMVNTMRQLGFAVGIAVLGTVFATVATRSLGGDSPAAHRLLGGQAQQIVAQSRDHAAVTNALHTASAAGLDAIFTIAGITGIIGGLLVLGLMWPRRPRLEAPVADLAEVG